jgi:hypothetical protein
VSGNFPGRSEVARHTRLACSAAAGLQDQACLPSTYSRAVVSSELSGREPMTPLPNQLVDAPVVDVVLAGELGY